MKGYSKPGRFGQIDILKGLAIISVLILHTVPVILVKPLPETGLFPLGVPTGVLTATLFNMLYGQGLPIFIVLMGVTSGLSFIKRGYVSLKDCYSLDYFYRRFLRFYVPYIFFLFAAFIVGRYETLTFGFNVNLDVFALVGVLPDSLGPGAWFVPVIFEFILIFPLLFYIYKKSPALLLVICFATTFVVDFVYVYLHLFSNFAYDRCVLRFLLAIALGLWIAGDFELLSSATRFSDLLSKRHGFYLTWALTGIITIFLTKLRQSSFLIHYPWTVVIARLNPFMLVYSVLPVILGISYLPNSAKNRFWSSLVVVGVASYHIFLLQILYFRLAKLSLWSIRSSSTAFYSVAVLLGNIAICTIFGLLFYYGTKKLESRLTNLF